MRIHELIKDAKLTKEGLEYLSDLDERIKQENKQLLNEIKGLQAEREELKEAFSFKEQYTFGWRFFERKSKDEVVEELRSEIDVLKYERKKYLDKIIAYNSKRWFSRLLSLNRKISISH